MTTEPEVEQVSPPETNNIAVSSLVGEIRGWARDVFFAIGTAIMIVVFLYQPVKVEGTSMLPELVDQERIFVNKFVYRIEKILWFSGIRWIPQSPISSASWACPEMLLKCAAALFTSMTRRLMRITSCL